MLVVGVGAWEGVVCVLEGGGESYVESGISYTCQNECYSA